MTLPFPKLHRTLAVASLAVASWSVTEAQTVTSTLANGDLAAAAAPSDSAGIRPDHLWTADYVGLLWSDTGAVITGPLHWNERDWILAGIAVASIAGSSSLDRIVERNVQAHRTASENRFFSQYQNFGSTWSFGVIGAFEVWGEAMGDTRAKDTAMDALTASIIGPGLIGTSVKYVAGRVRPNSAKFTFEFRPFSGNQAFPSGHTAQAFAVGTAIAENYPAWWVQTLCYGGATLVGYARIEQNAHATSDVVAGAILGWSVARQVVHRHDRPPSPKKLSWSPYVDGTGGGVLFFKSF